MGQGSYLDLLPAPLGSPCVASPTGFAKQGAIGLRFPIELRVLTA
jgi:hypothetical protein